MTILAEIPEIASAEIIPPEGLHFTPHMVDPHADALAGGLDLARAGKGLESYLATLATNELGDAMPTTRGGAILAAQAIERFARHELMSIRHAEHLAALKIVGPKIGEFPPGAPQALPTTLAGAWTDGSASPNWSFAGGWEFGIHLSEKDHAIEASWVCDGDPASTIWFLDDHGRKSHQSFATDEKVVPGWPEAGDPAKPCGPGA